MTTKRLKTRRRTKTESSRGLQTREALIKTATQILTTEGIHGFRFAQVAKSTKIPQALMGYHFQTNDALFIEVVQRELEKLKSLSIERIEKNWHSPRKALAAYICAPFELAAVDKTFRSISTAFYHLASIHPVFADLNLAIRKGGRERILNLITMVLASEGRLTHSLSPAQLIKLATSIQGVITGFTVTAMSESEADYDEFKKITLSACFDLLGLKESASA